MKPLLANPALKPAPADIHFAYDHFTEMLQIRQSSPLFRLNTAQDVINDLTFYNVGPNQTPGLIAYSLTDNGTTPLDPHYKQIVVVINATPYTQNISDPSFANQNYTLHPVQAASVDPIVKRSLYEASGLFVVPARTTAVFVLSR